jgi:hypothetical protein
MQVITQQDLLRRIEALERDRELRDAKANFETLERDQELRDAKANFETP